MLLVLPFVFLAATLQATQAGDAPPGMVLVPGGRTKIGIELRELERLLEADVNSQSYAGSLSAETPRREVALESFHLQVTEVTNEQYAAFARASGARPPEHWGDRAIDEGRKRFFEEQESAKARASAQGRPPPPAETFDRHVWWMQHWREAAWEVPAGDGPLPVVFIDAYDARAYARWAGLRLPTELEYERAVRNDTNQIYPWGNEWDNEKYAATNMLRKKGNALPVGSFPAGASRQGALDLAGNVWEWTSSSYTPFPGYEPKVYEFGFGKGRRQVNALADWNAQQRVVVGGSFQNSNLMARATTRRAADPAQSADALGFRCAGSLRPCLDLADAVAEMDLTANIRPRDARGTLEYAPERVLGAQRWSSVPTFERSWTPPAKYAVITRADHVLFAPVKMVQASEMTSLERLAFNEGPIQIGFLSTTLKMVEPPLPAGTYMLSWRAKGAPRFASTEARKDADGKPGPGDAAAPGKAASTSASQAPLEEVLAIDVAYDHLIFTDVNAKPVFALRMSIDYGPWNAGQLVFVDAAAGPDPGTGATGDPSAGAPSDPQAGATPDAGADAAMTARTLRFDVCLDCKTTKKGFLFSLPLRFEADDVQGAWRK